MFGGPPSSQGYISIYIYICAMVKSRVLLGMFTHPTFNDGNPYNGYNINPTIGDCCCFICARV